jgi:transposase-like protein
MDMRKVAREVRLSKWSQILQEQNASGQSIQIWCAENGIDRQQYYYWQRKLRESVVDSLAERSESLTLAQPTFTEISAPSSEPCTGVITVRVGEAVVEITGDPSPAALEMILQILSGR